MAGEGDPKKSFQLLGILEVGTIPCFRESVLYGSLGALTLGLGHFLATSRVRRSCHFGAGGFIMTTLGCWFYCRYNNAKLRIQQRIIQEGMKNRIMFEGTQFEPEKQKTSIGKSH
uniref:cytochrome c oxidase assembly protein COX20, mitochondrial n=1 Tax=Euleptes europaea TaxID=460621 RepID=UPI0025409F3D|nr:cytochrome c oxidase assembly protein COX20, mitochondrial [Euleptes europaea]